MRHPAERKSDERIRINSIIKQKALLSKLHTICYNKGHLVRSFRASLKCSRNMILKINGINFTNWIHLEPQICPQFKLYVGSSVRPNATTTRVMKNQKKKNSKIRIWTVWIYCLIQLGSTSKRLLLACPGIQVKC